MKKNNKKDYSKLSKEKLIAEIRKLSDGRQYGLVWEHKEEDVVKQCQKELPVFTEVKSKQIIVDQENPINLLIEGDNYHALSVLNYTHTGKIDVVYIDPPYNTGKKNEWKYNDRWVDKEDTFRHSKWLSFMEKRLRLTKNLLKNNGVIFISIDDNEVAQLKMLMDSSDLFRENNFVQNFMWLHGKGKKDSWSRTLQQYILCYAKNKNKLKPWSILSYANYEFSNPDNDPRGAWFSGSISFSETRSNKEHPNYFEIKSPSGIVWKRQWQRTKEEMEELLKKKKIFFGIQPKYDVVPRIKIFPKDISEQIPPNIIDGVESTREAQKKLDKMFEKKVFDYPKPVSLIKHIIKLSSDKNAVILDFFAGSGTTGEAILELNKEDGGNRQFILCTNNENNICTKICYPRIKKAILGYKNKKNLGGNLKYYKTSFVPKSKVSDDTKYGLVQRSTEMICIKEDTFDEVLNKKYIKIFKNKKQYTAILFHLDYFDDFKKELRKLNKPIHIYVFSLTNDTYENDFKDLKQKFDLCPIPESILEVYRKIFKE